MLFIVFRCEFRVLEYLVLISRDPPLSDFCRTCQPCKTSFTPRRWLLTSRCRLPSSYAQWERLALPRQFRLTHFQPLRRPSWRPHGPTRAFAITLTRVLLPCFLAMSAHHSHPFTSTRTVPVLEQLLIKRSSRVHERQHRKLRSLDRAARSSSFSPQK